MPETPNSSASVEYSRVSKPVVAMLLASLGVLLVFSSWLASHRIYQVDECQNVFVARLLATDKAQTSFTSVTLFLVPLSWLARSATHAEDLFAEARLFSLGIFWLNILLLTVAIREQLNPFERLIAVVGAATLAPLWDYGFEIRHDNLLLTGLLSMWCAIRTAPLRPAAYFVVGALAVVLEFVAFKAFVYTIPISIIGLAAVSRGPRSLVWRLVVAWVAGGAAAFVLVRVGYGAAGWWDLYIRDLRGISEVASGGYLFPPSATLGRLTVQMPLLVSLMILGLVFVGAPLWRTGRHRTSPVDVLPEALLLLVGVAVLFINRTPYPYNLVNVAPFAFLFAFRYGKALVENLGAHRGAGPVIGGLIVMGHLVPFVVSTSRHIGMTNDRQKKLMQTAEELTEPGKDSVYDGVGMVPTRESIHRQWLLHSLNLRNFVEGPGPRVRDMLASKPATVIIPNYRTDWLPQEDHAFIRERYVPLADDFWVLGTIVRGDGSFEIVHPGRYGVFVVGASTESQLLIGPHIKPLREDSVELATGKHRIECPAEYTCAVVWLGPRLRRMPQLGEGDHQKLFVNWY